MRKATFFLGFHLQNRVFDLCDPVANRDDGSFFAFDLKQEFAKSGFDLSTEDINPPSSSDLVLYANMPREEVIIANRQKSFLLIMEPPVVKPAGWVKKNWSHFSRIFTYDDRLVDRQTIFKFNYCYRIPSKFPDSAHRERFCATVIGNKSSRHPFELYSRRLEVIQWFEHNCSSDFDFYGAGWRDATYLESGLGGILLRKRRPYQTYRGPIDAKLPVLARYKFAICFENCGGVDGYISEKIFDAFFAGTVPVYLGAPNVSSHIPASAYVDYRNFASPSELVRYLHSMGERERMDYVEAAQRFLESPAAAPFRTDVVCSTLVETMVKALSSTPTP